MPRLTDTANSAMLATVLSHFLCCGLPVLVNVAALFAGVGALSAMVPWIDSLHEVLHEFELFLLLFSSLALGFGFLVHRAAAARDCATESCDHEPCAPKKRRSKLILIIASCLFVVNVSSYIWHLLG